MKEELEEAMIICSLCYRLPLLQLAADSFDILHDFNTSGALLFPNSSSGFRVRNILIFPHSMK